MMELRDRLAARMAASLVHSTLAPADIARRAYALADALLYERAQVCYLDEELYEDVSDDDAEREALALEHLAREHEAPHDPSWELSPRWSREDLVALESRRAGPGLAKSLSDEEDPAKRTG